MATTTTETRELFHQYAQQREVVKSMPFADWCAKQAKVEVKGSMLPVVNEQAEIKRQLGWGLR